MVRKSDIKILEILMKNARTSYVKIAEELGVSEAAIRKRIRRLENEGVILRYTIEVNPKKLGFEIVSIIGIDTKPERFISIISQLKEMEEIKKAFSSSGDHMILIETWFKNSDELEAFIKKLESIEGVTRVCPAIILERLK